MAMPQARPGAGVQRDDFALIALTELGTFTHSEEAVGILPNAATSSANHASFAIPQIIANFEVDKANDRLLACQDIVDGLALVRESRNSPDLEGFYFDEGLK